MGISASELSTRCRRSALFGFALTATLPALFALLVFSTVVRAQRAGEGALALSAPKVLALGVAIPVTGTGAPGGGQLELQRQSGQDWVRAATATADAQGGFSFRYRPVPVRHRYAFRVQATSGALSAPVVVTTRAITLASVGDVNLGDGPGQVMSARGPRYPWTSVAPVLRAADVAFGNLECSVSSRGRPVPKEFNFRGRPAWLKVLRRYVGFDALNLANNHVGDYGTAALADTVRGVRRNGMQPVGGGLDQADASQPRIVTRLGLRIAFVGFVDIQPTSFAAGPRKPGTIFASPEVVRREVRAARRRADVVIATFHWGVEKMTRENARQRRLAAAAVAAGATAVIGAHPHVLQPIDRRGRRLVAYSLGNFVFSASSPDTTKTGILLMRVSARGVEGVRFRRARIQGSRPVLERGKGLAVAQGRSFLDGAYSSPWQTASTLF